MWLANLAVAPAGASGFGAPDEAEDDEEEEDEAALMICEAGCVGGRKRGQRKGEAHAAQPLTSSAVECMLSDFSAACKVFVR